MKAFYFDAVKIRAARSAKWPDARAMEANRMTCELLDINLRTLFDAMQAKSKVSGTLLLNMAEVYGCDPRELVKCDADN